MAHKYLLTIQHFAAAGQVQSALAEKIESTNFRKIGDCSWIIKSDALTTKDLSQAIFSKPSEGKGVSHVIVRLESYWGWHDKELWEWLSVE